MNRTLLTLAFSIYTLLSYGQTITAVGAPFKAGGAFTFDYSGGTGAATDWIGVYTVGEIPDGTPPSLTWEYITSPAGTLVLNGNNQAAVLAAGDYTAHLFCCDGYDIIASVNFSIEGNVPSLLSHRSHPIANKRFKFAYSGGTGSPTDWIGIYKPNDTPGVESSITYTYVTAKEGDTSFVADSLLPPGNYKAYFFCCDGYDVLAKDSFTVYEALPSSLKLAPITNGDPFKFTFTGTLGNLNDWIGIFPAGEVPASGNLVGWDYLPGVNGQIDLGTTLETGKAYDAHMLCCDGYDIIASVLNFSLPTSTKDINSKNIFRALNNPISALSPLKLQFDEATSGTISVYNLTGQLTQKVQINNERNIEINNLIAGSYYIRFVNSESQQTIKVMAR